MKERFEFLKSLSIYIQVPTFISVIVADVTLRDITDCKC